MYPCFSFDSHLSVEGNCGKKKDFKQKHLVNTY